MSTQFVMPADQSEQLRKVGLWCASTITCHLDAWRSTARWILKLPLCQAIAKTDDAHNPNLHDGRNWIVDPRSPENHTIYVYDDEVEAGRISGPNSRRLFNVWDAARYRFLHRPDDRFFDFGIDDAKRFALLAALILNRDFDGAALGLAWSWDYPEGCRATFEGRQYARENITSVFGAEALLLELIEMAIDHLEERSIWQMTTKDGEEPEQASDGSAAGDDVAGAVTGEQQVVKSAPTRLVTGRCNAMELATLHNLDPAQAEAMRKKLERWRPSHCNGEWIEVPNRKPHTPKYLYDPDAVRSLIEAVKSRSAKMSNERPSARK